MSTEQQENTEVKVEELNTDTVIDTVIDKYEYGDLMLKCHLCGALYPIEKMVPGTHGIQVILTPQSNSTLNLTCNTCKSTIELIWQKSSEEDIQELKNKENDADKEGKEE